MSPNCSGCLQFTVHLSSCLSELLTIELVHLRIDHRDGKLTKIRVFLTRTHVNTSGLACKTFHEAHVFTNDLILIGFPILILHEYLSHFCIDKNGGNMYCDCYFLLKFGRWKYTSMVPKETLQYLHDSSPLQKTFFVFQILINRQFFVKWDLYSLPFLVPVFIIDLVSL